MAGIIIFGGALICLLSARFLPLKKQIRELYISRMSAEKRDMCMGLSARSSFAEIAVNDLNKRLFLMMVIAGMGLVLSVAGLRTSDEKNERYIERPEFGEGEKQVSLSASAKGLLAEISISDSEKEPEGEEVDAFFDEAIKSITGYMLAENEAFDHIDSDLYFFDRASAVKISWSISDTTYLKSNGSLRGEIPSEGADTVLLVELAYGKYTRSYEFELCLYPEKKELTKEEELESYIYENISVSKDYIILPEMYEDSEISYGKKPEEKNSLLVIILAFGIICWIVSGDNIEKADRRRRMELERDYPSIVSRLSILLMAGMSVSESVCRIARDYEASNKGRTSAGYEEISYAARRINNTREIEVSLSVMGKRCRHRYYMQLSSVLIQSIRKGSVSVSDRLSEATKEAFRLRKENARVIGEKAGAKLMLPSFLLFALVMAIVIFPAWTGI